jgi:hypothetical protein
MLDIEIKLRRNASHYFIVELHHLRKYKIIVANYQYGVNTTSTSRASRSSDAFNRLRPLSNGSRVARRLCSYVACLLLYRLVYGCFAAKEIR